MPIRRTLKNVVYNFSDAQVKVREATSNDPWGPSSTLMSEIADLTYNVVAFTEIMQMIWKRLNDHGKNWRHVYKALVVLDYIIKTGSEKVAQQCKENIYAIQTLKDFQYAEENKDQGMNVREKAKQLVSLLKDDERLRNERAKALKAKERFAQNSMGIGSSGPTSPAGMSRSQSDYLDTFRTSSAGDSPSADPANPEMESARPTTLGEEELQLQLALAMSKEEADEAKRRERDDDVRLAMALEESRKEREKDETPGGDTLLDLLGATAGAAATDPWGAPLTNAAPAADPWAPRPSSTPAQASMDAWNSPSQPRPASTDPWSGGSAQSPPPYQEPSQPAVVADPWAPVGSAPQPQQAASPWGSPPPQNGTHGEPTLDDAFDLLSSRKSEPMKNGNGSTSPNLFDMGGLGDALEPMSNHQDGRKKTAEEFLGANANLVNLDNLVSKPTGTGNTTSSFSLLDDFSQSSGRPDPVGVNPFAMTTAAAAPPNSNPFALQQQPQRVPMNQMSSSSSMGFTGTTTGPVLPTPLMPNNQGMGAQPQANMMYGQYNNPFL